MARSQKVLLALLNGREVARVEQGAGGQLALEYADAWLEDPDAFPLSLSLPLARRIHKDAPVRAFLEGLLPENPRIREGWARRFSVSPGNPFTLLRHMGEDCAGAVQFVEPAERGRQERDAGGLEWLSEAEVAALLRELVSGAGTGRPAGSRGRFSLAGAQPKTALLQEDGRWGIPFGPVASTHILKPPAQADLEGLSVNEHICLNLARAVGLNAASSKVERFEDQAAIVVERYDRRRGPGGRVDRIHQEDLAQALGILPWQKYESEGGPSVPDVVRLLETASDDPADDVGAFLDAVVLNWALGGTDAHAKNYSLLLTPSAVRLAPLYDLVSVLPYPLAFPYRRMKTAMRIDREVHVWKIRRRHWEGLATRCDLDPGPFLARARTLVGSLPEATRTVCAAVGYEGLSPDFVQRMEDALSAQAELCQEALR